MTGSPAGMVRSVVLLAVVLGAIGTAEAAVPATLACTAGSSLNWRAEAPELIPHRDDDEFGGPVIHLAPASGEWYLSIPGSAALTSDGGTFDVVRNSGFAAYHEEWVGMDGDSMLRIYGYAERMRFIFLSGDRGAVFGTCSEPDEPFIFLSRGPAS